MSLSARNRSHCFPIPLVRHGYSEHDVEDAVLHRKPIASRALYNLIERRLKEGLGWPDPNYNTPTNAHSSLSTTASVPAVDGASDVVVLDKLIHNEPLLPSRRAVAHPHPHLHPPQHATVAGAGTTTNGRRFSRDRTNYTYDEQVVLHTNGHGNIITGGLTQEAFNELVPTPKLASRKLFQDIILRKPSANARSVEAVDEHAHTKRSPNPTTFSSIRPLVTAQRGNVVTPQQPMHTHKPKPRSLPNSTLDHANQNGFHLPHDPLASGARTPKTVSRASNAEYLKRSQQQSPVRYNAGTLHAHFFRSHGNS